MVSVAPLPISAGVDGMQLCFTHTQLLADVPLVSLACRVASQPASYAPLLPTWTALLAATWPHCLEQQSSQQLVGDTGPQQSALHSCLRRAVGDTAHLPPTEVLRIVSQGNSNPIAATLLLDSMVLSASLDPGKHLSITMPDRVVAALPDALLHTAAVQA